MDMDQNAYDEWLKAEKGDYVQDNQMEYVGTEINNAGLCLLSPFFPRLFSILGYLGADRKFKKDEVTGTTETGMKIRAIFLLQYLLHLEERKYDASELLFNRLLVNLPKDIKLPEQLALNDKEKQIAEEMLNSAKSNWTVMRHTSMKAYQETFLNRIGWLNQEDDKWVLGVTERAYDVLLDRIPWSFQRIRYPWMDKLVEVKWRDR